MGDHECDGDPRHEVDVGGVGRRGKPSTRKVPTCDKSFARGRASTSLSLRLIARTTSLRADSWCTHIDESDYGDKVT